MTWILFDYAGVISHPQSAAAVSALADTIGTTPERFSAGYWADRAAYDVAAVDAATYWQGVAGRPLGPDVVARLVELDTLSWLRINEETVDLLEQEAARGANLALLSNAPVELARAVEDQPFAALFPFRFFSADLGMAKPDPRVYEHVCRALEIRPDELVFVDDRGENVDAARELGIDARLFTSPDRLVL